MENVPKRKKHPGLSKGAALGLLVLLAALIGAALLLWPAHAPLPPLTEKPAAFLLLPRPVEEIASVEIAAGEGAPVALVRTEGGFALRDHEDTPLRSFVMEDLSLSLGKVPAQAEVLPELYPAQGLTAEAFGLNPPKARVDIVYQDGETRSLLVGSPAPNEETPQRYCMLAGDPKLYTLLSADSDVFFYELDDLRAFDQPQLNPDLLDRIDVTGALEWHIFYTPSGWQMEAPFAYPLAPAKMETLLNRVKSMAFEACLGAAVDLPLSAYGLDAPALTVTLTQAPTVITGETEAGETVTLPVPEKTYTLALGDETGQSGVYALWEGQVFKASNFLFGFWKTLNPLDYALTAPVNFLVNNLSAVRLTAPGVEAGYQVRMVESITENNQIAVDEYGRTLYDCAVRREGEAADMDPEAFLAWYQQLAALRGEGRLPEDYKIPAGEPVAALTLQNDSLTREIALYPFDALHYALAVDGTALYYVSRAWLDQAMRTP